MPARGLVTAVAMLALAFLAAPAASADLSTWTVQPIDDHVLHQGACPTTTLCVVPDDAGRLLVATDPLGSWAASDVDGTSQIHEVSCVPTTSLCLAVDEAGNVLTSNTPTTGTSWNSTPVDSVAPGAGEGLWSISCPSTSLCVAVDNYNHVFTSTDPAAHTWSGPVTIDSASPGLFRVHCSSTTFCVAVDESGNVITSTNPTGAATAWTQTKIDGTTPIYSIDCTGTALCVAGDSDGKLLWSTDPTGGASSWHTEPGDGYRVFGVSCPSTSLCVAADNAGGIEASTDPTSAGTWSVVAATNVGAAFLGLMCPSATLCVAPSYNGKVAVSTAAGPAVSTGSADALAATGATLHGTVNPEGSTVTDCHFDYGTTSNPYSGSVPCAETVGGGSTDVNVHADISGLEPSATYHFRLVATTGAATGTGTDASFVTAASAPDAITENADGIGVHTATLEGIVYPYNQTVTDCHFDYGTSSSPYTGSVPCAETVGGGYGPVTVHADITGLTNNLTYHFRVVAANATGPADGDDVIFVTDAVDTTITGGPGGPTNDATPAFAFTADPPAGATFTCWFDSSAPQTCTSPLMPTSPLADGPHTLHVQAAAGVNTDPTPATRDFLVDTVAPVTKLQIAGGSRVGQSTNYHGNVLLLASATDAAPSSGSVQTRCEFEGAEQPPPASFDVLPADGCTPLITPGPGDYVFYAASHDAAGNAEVVRSAAFTILPAVEVSITSAPSGDTWAKQPSFGFDSSTAGASFRCRIDQGSFVACSSPWLSPVQDPGKHAFYVYAIAPDGTESNVQASYYTIQAARTATGHCAVDPFVVDPGNPNGGGTVGCGFGSCPSRIACSPPIDPCPTGAICTLQFTSHFADDDSAVTFNLVPFCQSESQGASDCLPDEIDDIWRVFQRFGAVLRNQCEAQPLTDPKTCDATSTETIIGTNRTISPICYAELEDVLYSPIKPGAVRPRDFGTDSSRHIDCDASESISPASALDLASVTPELYESYVYVPAAGHLALTGALIAAFTARKHPAGPGFIPIKINVTHPGSVPVRFRLNRAAKRVLARRHTLRLRVEATLTVPHQRSVTRIQVVTFTQPPKPLSARQRRQEARRLCVRKHPHQVKLCDRI